MEEVGVGDLREIVEGAMRHLVEVEKVVVVGDSPLIPGFRDRFPLLVLTRSLPLRPGLTKSLRGLATPTPTPHTTPLLVLARRLPLSPTKVRENPTPHTQDPEARALAGACGCAPPRLPQHGPLTAKPRQAGAQGYPLFTGGDGVASAFATPSPHVLPTPQNLFEVRGGGARIVWRVARVSS